MFAIGDKVVYPMHGAGVIEAIEVKCMRGAPERYYVLHLPVGGMRVMVPQASAEDIGLRPVIDVQEVPNVLAALGQRGEVEAQAWNRRYRANLERLRCGDVLEVVRVIRDLTRRDRFKGLSTAERKMLENARLILISELALATDSSNRDMETALDEALV